MPQLDAPAGFRRSVASGLILPEEISRKREVWTYQEWRTIDKATKLLAERGIQVLMRCSRPECQDKPMERIRRHDGGITLRCNHVDREYTKL